MELVLSEELYGHGTPGRITTDIVIMFRMEHLRNGTVSQGQSTLRKVKDSSYFESSEQQLLEVVRRYTLQT